EPEPPSSQRVLVTSPLTLFQHTSPDGGFSSAESRSSSGNGSPRNGRTTLKSGYRRLQEPPRHGTDGDRNAAARQRRAFRREFFPDATDKDWNDWSWQSRHRFRTLAQIERVLTLADDEREAMQAGGMMLPVGITPYYMSLLD